MTPGPCEIPERALKALSHRVMHPFFEEEFFELYIDICKMLKDLLSTDNVLVLPGSGSLGLESLIASLYNSGKKVLCVENGFFGLFGYELFSNYRYDCVKVSGDLDRSIGVDKIEKILDEDIFDYLFLVHCETISGVMNDISKIGRIAYEHGVNVIVDAVSSVGTMPLSMKNFNIDALVTASQKGLCAPPGLSVIAFNDKVKDIILSSDNKSFCLNLKVWMENLSEKEFPYTVPVNLFYALYNGLKVLYEERLENVYLRHSIVSEFVKDSLEQLGLKLFPRRCDSCTGVSVVKSPEGINVSEIIRYIKYKYGIVIASGWGRLKDRIFRIGHMGYSARLDYATRTLDALKDALVFFNYY